MNTVSKIQETKVKRNPTGRILSGKLPDLPGERWLPFMRDDLNHYCISSKGRIKKIINPNKEQLMSNTPKDNGSCSVSLTTKKAEGEKKGKKASFTVHDLVFGHFMLNRFTINEDGGTMVVEHKDTNKSNNDVSNLRLMTKGDQAVLRNKARAENPDNSSKRPITQFDLDGNHVHDWKNVKEACKKLPPLRPEDLVNCIGNGRKRANSTWEFTNEEDDFVENQNDVDLPDEIWLPIEPEGYPHYHISSEGRFKNVNTRHVYNIKDPESKDDYKAVLLKGKKDKDGNLDKDAKVKRCTVHRLTAKRL